MQDDAMTPSFSPRPDAAMPARQRGAALLMAMVIVTVVATLASSMVWQQWRSVQVESAERARAQSQWILMGILDFSAEVLRQDGARDPGSYPRAADTLAAEWAKPLQESRISSFLSIDKDNTDDAPDAFMSIRGTDLDSRYNLRNLLMPAPNNQGAVQIDSAQLAVLKELFLYTRVPDLTPALADLIANGLEKATLAAMSSNTAAFNAVGQAAGVAQAPVMPQTIDQLVWLPGLNADLVSKMRPFVALLPYSPNLPATIPINVNTAPKEVIAAVWGMGPAEAERLVQLRAQQKNRGFAQISDAEAAVSTKMQLPGSVNVFSDYFEVTSRLRMGDSVMQQRNVVRRNVQSRTQVIVDTLHQERVSGVDPGP
jgi:general secretion pathway protein K